jgi:chloride channel 7
VVQKVYETFELLPMLLVGIMGGLLGSLFNHLNEHLTRWRKQHVTTIRQKLWDVAAVAVLSATLSFILPLTVECRVRT